MALKPGPHPHPPPNFAKKTLSLRTFPAKTKWHRFHREGLQATFFGKSGLYRFDDPQRDYGVLYLAQHLEGAFVEVFLREPEPFRFVTRMALESRVLSILRASRSVKLVDLVGAGLARMGVDSRLTTGSYEVAQQWSRAFHAHPARPDGILYRSRHDPDQLCAAIFDKTRVSFREESAGALFEYLGADRTYALLARYGVGLG